MSRCNCPNCGAPYITLGIRCDYCGCLKPFDETDTQDRTVVYANGEPFAVFVDCDSITLSQDIVTKINGQIAERNRMLIHDLI